MDLMLWVILIGGVALVVGVIASIINILVLASRPRRRTIIVVLDEDEDDEP